LASAEVQSVMPGCCLTVHRICRSQFDPRVSPARRGTDCDCSYHFRPIGGAFRCDPISAKIGTRPADPSPAWLGLRKHRTA
jgi:hypothetical protein